VCVCVSVSVSVSVSVCLATLLGRGKKILNPLALELANMI
jgi:hypothetical protein